MDIVILSTSLDPNSKSRILALSALEYLHTSSIGAKLVDLVDHPLPLCDGYEARFLPEAKKLTEELQQADGILVAGPVYNYDIGAAAKNLIELCGDGFVEKPVGFLLAAGGHASYMAPMGFVNSLMLDFRSLIIPRFVYTTGDVFEDGKLLDPKIQDRIQALVTDMANIIKGRKLLENQIKQES